jgi:hypothetical protein
MKLRILPAGRVGYGASLPDSYRVILSALCIITSINERKH